MLTEESKALLEAGSALIVGLTLPSGLPFATRAWGFDVDDSGTSGRMLVREVDLDTFGLQVGDTPDSPIAVTAADVRSLLSVQVKGTLVEVAPSQEGDAERMHRYCDLFVAAVHAVDNVPLEVADRWRPDVDILLRCQIVFEEAFVQTPGPGAGASLGRVGA